ncbi:DUF1501 domain-containing protein [Bremerella sp.]|uniref:DUF1501 domain-containing protein n=1 Tax=Bremerella sp. TaxID=2795602 RepID=UPI00391ACB5C
MNVNDPTPPQLIRRDAFKGIGGMLATGALHQLFGSHIQAEGHRANPPGTPGFPNFAPKAKRVIYLFQAGGPSQIDLFDYKPLLKNWDGRDLPQSVMGDVKFTGMVNGQAHFPVVAPRWRLGQHGKSGAWVSELFPEFAKVVDDVCFIKSMTTTQVDHDGAITYLQTGHQIAGRPSMGAWAAYGLGSVCDDLPAFVVLRTNKGGSFLIDRHWGAGFLPSRYQGIPVGGAGQEPVQYLGNPKGFTSELRSQTIADIAKFNRQHEQRVGDPEISTRIAQFEMAARMQMSVPDLADFSDEPQHVLDLYGDDVRQPGSYAHNALMARRLAERGVRFVQVFQGGWDQHSNLPKQIEEYASYTDRANAALILDLKQRGMLDDTLVIWGGEFGRTVFCQGKLTKTNFGREHHHLGFTMWMAGAGIKPGYTHGATDEWSFHATENPVPVHDLNATVLHLLGINHKHLTYRFQGRDFRLTDLAGNVVKEILA